MYNIPIHTNIYVYIFIGRVIVYMYINVVYSVSVSERSSFQSVWNAPRQSNIKHCKYTQVYVNIYMYINIYIYIYALYTYALGMSLGRN